MQIMTMITLITMGMLTLAPIPMLSAYANPVSTAKYYTILGDLRDNKNAMRKQYTTFATEVCKKYSDNPQSDDAPDYIFACATIYWDSYTRYAVKSDMDNALRYYRLVATNYETDLAARGYLETSAIYELQEDYASALYNYNRVLTRFSGSPYADEALKKIDTLTKKFGGAPLPKETAAQLKNTNGINRGVVDEIIQPIANSKTNNGDPLGDASFGLVIPANSNTQAQEDNLANGFELLKSFRHYSGENYTRLVIDLSDSVSYTFKDLPPDPKFNRSARIFIDLKNTTVNKDIPATVNVNDSHLQQIRWAVNRPGVVRVVLGLDKPTGYRVFELSSPRRIVVDISDDAPLRATLGGSTTLVSKDVDIETLAQVIGVKIRNVVVDPGHGGKDPGAIYYGLKEKDIVLDISKRLAKQLATNKDLSVYLTRSSNKFIELDERTAFANKRHADLFLSVHANAHTNPNLYGVMTFVLNITKDKTSLDIAAFENQATTKAMSDLQGIMYDIILGSKLEESLLLANYVQKGILGELKLGRSYDKGVRQAPFYVLVGARMPSILIETGFLSNKNDAARFKSSRNLDKYAEGISKGVFQYIENYNGKK